MLEEIKVLQQIIGDLSSVGLGVVGMYVAYKILIAAAWVGCIGFIVTKIYRYFTGDITRFQHDEITNVLESKAEDYRGQISRLSDRIAELTSTQKIEIESLKANHKNELERVQFMYSQLKKSMAGEKEGE